MASVCSPRRQLAPTVGPEVALDGIHIRAGVLEISGERTVSALVQRIYAIDMIYFRINGCRRGEQTDAMGWLKLGPNVR